MEGAHPDREIPPEYATTDFTTALYAAVKAGQDAFRREATSAEVVAAIHAAGAKSNDP